ncbi:hypothetical protein K1719_039067 [Acacia pycnantha]|nr:hypothetical protein K1719_039067 [Acacia pycnantha]
MCRTVTRTRFSSRENSCSAAISSLFISSALAEVCKPYLPFEAPGSDYLFITQLCLAASFWVSRCCA